jgi:glyoxylase-like metal-dependent hydrolase (beta-lactamase superfamily II)
MKLSLINITDFRVDGGAMFGVIPRGMWNRSVKADENNNIGLSLRSLIIETEEKVILIDAGWGDKQDEKFFRHTWLSGGEGLLEGLTRCGYKTEDVTDIILTHLHADHCGGCFAKSRDGRIEPVFPNAAYHVSRAQWEWAIDSNLREADAFLPENILPIGDSGKLNLVEENGPFCNGVSLRICYGHTPGLLVPVINYNGRGFIFTGDLIPTVAHIPLLWNMSYDLLPLVTIAEKEEMLKEALIENHVLIFQHDEETECCTLTETPRGIRADEKKPLSYYL